MVNKYKFNSFGVASKRMWSIILKSNLDYAFGETMASLFVQISNPIKKVEKSWIHKLLKFGSSTKLILEFRFQCLSFKISGLMMFFRTSA